MKKPDTSIIFFGTPRFAVYVLEELAEVSIVPAIVVTQPDRPAGRGLKVKEPPVKTWALEHGIPVIQESLNAKLQTLNVSLDLFIVAAYGKILPAELLNLPAKGVLNVHPSLLPKFRGASPIESQILADEREVGVSIMELDEEMDHGPIVAQASITPEEWPIRASMLEELLAREGGKLLAEAIPPYMEDKIIPEPQDHTKATFTKKISKEDGLIQLSDDPYSNYLKFCAYDGWPGTYFFQNGKRVKIADAKYESGAFAPLRVIPEGKKETGYQDYLRSMG